MNPAFNNPPAPQPIPPLADFVQQLHSSNRRGSFPVASMLFNRVSGKTSPLTADPFEQISKILNLPSLQNSTFLASVRQQMEFLKAHRAILAVDERLFAHIHGDIFLGSSYSTSLAGDVIEAPAEYLVRFFKVLKQYPFINLDPNGVLYRNLDYFIALLDSYVVFARTLEKINRNEIALEQYCSMVSATARGMVPGQSLLIPGGWKGHAIATLIQKVDADKYTLRFENSGAGREYNNSIRVGFKMPRNAFIEIGPITIENFHEFIKVMTELLLINGNSTMFFNCLLPYLKTVSTGDPSHVICALKDFVTGQRGGSCPWKTLMCLFRTLLPIVEFKKLKLDIKKISGAAYFLQHELELVNSRSSQVLFKNSLEKLARSALKNFLNKIINTEELAIYYLFILELRNQYEAIARHWELQFPEQQFQLDFSGNQMEIDPPLPRLEDALPPLTPADPGFSPQLDPFQSPLFRDYSPTFLLPDSYLKPPEESWHLFLYHWYGYLKTAQKDMPPAKQSELFLNIDQLFVNLPLPSSLGIDEWSAISSPAEREAIIVLLHQLACMRLTQFDEKNTLAPTESKVLTAITAYAVIDKLARLSDPILIGFGTFLSNQERIKNLWVFDPIVKDRILAVLAYFQSYGIDNLLFKEVYSNDYSRSLGFFIDLNSNDKKCPEQEYCDALLQQKPELESQIPPGNLPTFCKLMAQFSVGGVLPLPFVLLRNTSILAMSLFTSHARESCEFSAVGQIFNNNLFSFQILLDGKSIYMPNRWRDNNESFIADPLDREKSERGGLAKIFPSPMTENEALLQWGNSSFLSRQFSSAKFLDLLRLDQSNKLCLVDLISYFTLYPEEINQPYFVYLFDKYLMQNPTVLDQFKTNPRLLLSLKALLSTLQTTSLLSEDYSTTAYLFFFEAVLCNYERYICNHFDEERLLVLLNFVKRMVYHKARNNSVSVTVLKIISELLCQSQSRISPNPELIAAVIGSAVISSELDNSGVPPQLLQQAHILNSYYQSIIAQATPEAGFFEGLLNYIVQFAGNKEAIFDPLHKWMLVRPGCFQRTTSNGIYEVDMVNALVSKNSMLQTLTPSYLLDNGSYQAVFGSARFQGVLSVNQKTFEFVNGLQYTLAGSSKDSPLQVRYENFQYEHRSSFSSGNLRDDYLRQKLSAHYSEKALTIWAMRLESELRVLFINAENEVVARETLSQQGGQWVSQGIQRVSSKDSEARGTLVEIDPNNFQILSRFALRQHIFTWKESISELPDDSRYTIEFKGQNLSFSASRSNPKALSKQYSGYSLAQQQTIRSFPPDFRNYLILDKGSRRIVLIPFAQFTAVSSMAKTLPLIKDLQLENVSRHLKFELNFEDHINFGSTTHNLYLAYLYLALKEYSKAFEYLKNCSLPTRYNEDCRKIFYWISDLLGMTADTHPDALFLQLYAAYLQSENSFRDPKSLPVADFTYWHRIYRCLEDYIARYANLTLGQLQLNEVICIEQALRNTGLSLSEEYLCWKNDQIRSSGYTLIAQAPAKQALDQLNSWNPHFTPFLPENFDLKTLHQAFAGKQIVEYTYKGTLKPRPNQRLITLANRHFLQNFWDYFQLAISQDPSQKNKKTDLLLELAFIQNAYERAPSSQPLKRDPEIFTCYFWSIVFSLLINHSHLAHRTHLKALFTLVNKYGPMKKRGMSPASEQAFIGEILEKASIIISHFLIKNGPVKKEVSYAHQQPAIFPMPAGLSSKAESLRQKDTPIQTVTFLHFDMQNYLVALPASPFLGDFNFDLLLATENRDPRIQSAFQQFNVRALAHRKRKTAGYRLKNFHELESQLRTSLVETRRSLSTLKFQIIDLFNQIDIENEMSLLNVLEQQGGKLRVMEFKELIGLFLNGQLRGHPNLQFNVHQILLLSRQADSFERALELVEEYKRLGSGQNVLAKEVELANRISDELSGLIPYSTSEYPEILVFECIANRRVYPHQFKDFRNFFEHNPYTRISSLRWLIQNIRTGRGKSSVLLALLCFLIAHAKTQPSSQPNDRAKKNLFSLPVIVVPQALVPSTIEQLHKNTLNHLGQGAYYFQFSRGQAWTASQLDYLYSRLTQTCVEKGYILTAREDIQALQLAFLEILYSAAILSDFSRLDVLSTLRKILILFKEHGIAVLDEADFILHDRFELHYSLGEKRALNPNHINLFRKVLQILFTDDGKLLKEFQRLNFLETTVPEAEFRAIKVNFVEGFVRASWGRLGICPLPESIDYTAFAVYLSGYAPSPDWLEAFAGEIKELIALVKGQFSILFPLTLNRQAQKHFGFSKDPAVKIAVPFHDEKPSENSLHQNPYESVIYTILAYLNLPAPVIAQKVIEWVKSEIRDEICKARAAGASLLTQHTQTYKRFSALFPTIQLALIDETQYEQIGRDFLERPELIFDFLQKSVLGQISIFPIEISSNGVNFIEMFAHALGFAATTSNAPTYHPRLECDHSQNSDVETVALIKDSRLAFIQDAFPVNRVLAELYEPNTKVFIDAGSYFKDSTEEGKIKIAREFLQYFLTLPDCKIKAIAFHNDKNELVAIQDLHSEPGPILRPETVEDDLFILLWPAYIAGTDFVFHDAAEGIVVLSAKMDFRSFIQAVGRMRGLEKGQKVKFLISQSEAAIVRQRLRLPETMEVTIRHILSICKENEEQELNRSLIHSTKQMLSNLVRRELVNSLLQLEVYPAVDFFRNIQQTGTNQLLQDQTLHPWAMYGEMPVLQKTEQYLTDILENGIMALQNIFPTAVIDRIRKEGREIIQSKIGERLLPADILNITFEHDKMQQVQVSTEQDQQLQQADKVMAFNSAAKPWRLGEPLNIAVLNLQRPIFKDTSSYADYFMTSFDFLRYLQTFCGASADETNTIRKESVLSIGKSYYQKHRELLTSLEAQVKEEIRIVNPNKRLRVERFKESDTIERIDNLLAQLVTNLLRLDLSERTQAQEVLKTRIREIKRDVSSIQERIPNGLAQIDYPSIAIGRVIDYNFYNLPVEDFDGLELSVNFLNLSSSKAFMSSFPSRWSKPIRFVLLEKSVETGKVRSTVLSSEEFDFLRGQLRFDSQAANSIGASWKFCLYHLTSGYTATGANRWTQEEVLNDPTVQLQLVKMKLLNGVVHYSEAELETLKIFIRNYVLALRYEKFLHERILPLHTYKDNEFDESPLNQLLTGIKTGPHPLADLPEMPPSNKRESSEDAPPPKRLRSSESAIRNGKRKANS